MVTLITAVLYSVPNTLTVTYSSEGVVGLGDAFEELQYDCQIPVNKNTNLNSYSHTQCWRNIWSLSSAELRSFQSRVAHLGTKIFFPELFPGSNGKKQKVSLFPGTIPRSFPELHEAEGFEKIITVHNESR